MNIRNIVYLLSFVLVSFVGCSSTAANNDNRAPRQEGISILRFDKELYDYLSQPDTAKESALKQKYPILLIAYGRITMNENDSQNYFSSLRQYFSVPALMQLYRNELSTFSDLSSYEAQLDKADLLVKENLPGKKLPRFSMHVSGYRENVIILHDLISISADKYLGSEYSGYRAYFKPYERQQMQPNYLVRDYIKAWILSDNLIKESPENANLLTDMVNEGKVLYALSKLLPDMKAEDIIGYTTEQNEWCKKNEKKIWQTIVKENHLFSTDHMIITKYINDAPNTAPLGAESPGRVGAWTGWQMINQYVKKTGATLDDVLRADEQLILKQSKYNP